MPKSELKNLGPVDMTLVDSDDAIGPHVVFNSRRHGEQIMTFNLKEVIALREWCERVLANA